MMQSLNFNPVVTQKDALRRVFIFFRRAIEHKFDLD